MSDALELLTPEGVIIRMPLAGVAGRTAAWLIDASIVAGSVNLLDRLLTVFLPGLAGLAAGISILAFLAASVLYGAALEYFWGGRTVGKFLFGLRVVDAGGLRLGGPAVLMRNLLRAVDALPALYLVGGAVMVASARLQRIGDLVSGTVVVRPAAQSPPQADAWPPGRFNSLRAAPVLCARLRQRVSPAEAELLTEALRAAPALAPEIAAQLFRALVERFQALAEFPPELTSTLSDEQYLRAVAGLLFTQAPMGAH